MRVSTPAQCGFTLLELLLVVAVIAITAGAAAVSVSAVSPPPVEKEAQRLAALLDVERAHSRSSGVPSFFVISASGFEVQRLRQRLRSERWQHDSVQAESVRLTLGPEPVLSPQRVVLADRSGAKRWVQTDGIRPFTVEAVQ